MASVQSVTPGLTQLIARPFSASPVTISLPNPNGGDQVPFGIGVQCGRLILAFNNSLIGPRLVSYNGSTFGSTINWGDGSANGQVMVMPPGDLVGFGGNVVTGTVAGP